MAYKDKWSAQEYNQTVPWVYSAEYTRNILQLLDARPGEKICDFGCGSGEITLELQKIVGNEGRVFGLDSSESMIERARANGVKVVWLADIQDLSRATPVQEASCDAVFSNATLHWCKRDPGGVLESAKRVLRRGGRFVVEFGGFTNCIGIRCALHQVMRLHGYDPTVRDPWYFPSAEEYQDLLETHGFKVIHITLNPRFTPLKSDIRDWVHLFCKDNFLADMDEKESCQIMEEVNELCAVDCRDSTGRWSAMYTRLRVVAVYE